MFFAETQNKKILKGSGSISNSEMEAIVGGVYEDFNQKRKHYEALIADQNDMDEIKRLEQQLKKRKKD